jgi:hypothetical protein
MGLDRPWQSHAANDQARRSFFENAVDQADVAGKGSIASPLPSLTDDFLRPLDFPAATSLPDQIERQQK